MRHIVWVVRLGTVQELLSFSALMTAKLKYPHQHCGASTLLFRLASVRVLLVLTWLFWFVASQTLSGVVMFIHFLNLWAPLTPLTTRVGLPAHSQKS